MTSTGVGKITINSSTFSTYITGAYCSAQCTNYATNTTNINSTGTYYLVYAGNTKPKSGVNVTVRITLVGYSASRSVAAIGSISA